MTKHRSTSADVPQKRGIPFVRKRSMVLFCLGMFLLALPLLVRVGVWRTIAAKNKTVWLTDSQLLQKQAALEKDLHKLDAALQKKTPSTYYLIINSASNEFRLYKGHQLIKKDKCSTGSYILLKNDQNQQWMFKTPKGEFRIQGKTTSPVWKKPDWAFVEEGMPVPSATHPSRYAYGVLGDYALSLGNGYLIHGTLYQRFLGLPVTHGCVRLNDENLELVYNTLQVGSKVFIY